MPPAKPQKPAPTVVQQRRGVEKLLAGLTPPQLAFVEDPSRHKAASPLVVPGRPTR